MAYTASDGTVINTYLDSTGDGIKDSSTPTGTTDLENVKAIWKAGRSLWETAAADRTIFTTVNGSDRTNFVSTAAELALIEPHLRAADSTEAANIINWIRGDDLAAITDAGHPTGYRERSITIDTVDNTPRVWKLGDIVYSTPTVVGKPLENYDLLYNDSSYSSFYKTYRNRLRIVYAGANDGMLHAFNAGCYDEKAMQYHEDVDASGNCVAYDDTDPATPALGQELWAFVPRGLLPHLKWNTMRDYTHVYHVDGKPKITDVDIFDSGWGTILIGSYRYGGKDISWSHSGTPYSASPEYFAIDITNPKSPRLLWTFSDPGLGLSMAYPSVAKVNGEWFVIIGSGPTNYDTSSNLTAYQAGNIYALKISGGGADGVISTWTANSNFWKIPTGEGNSFISDGITVDVDIDYDVDVMYLGENTKDTGTWNVLMRRITTDKGTQSNPASWTLSTVGDVNDIAGPLDSAKKITSAPSAAMNNRGDLYLYFGTGQFYGTDDRNITESGGFYAIKDACWDGSCTTPYTDLLNVSDASVNIDGSVTGVTGTCGGLKNNWSNLLSSSYACDGWAMYFKSLGESTDFNNVTLKHDGERVLGKPLILGGLATFSTYVPGMEVCTALGESNVYSVYYETGTAYKRYLFEEQKDQTTPSDEVARTQNLGIGMPSSPSVQITDEGKAKLYFQQSTGSILTIENETASPLKSGIEGWKSEEIP